MTVNEEKLMGYVHQAVGDFGAILTGALVTLGDKLGLFAALAGAGPLTAEELADRTDTDERYVREWVSGQAAAGYVDYDGRRPLPRSTRSRRSPSPTSPARPTSSAGSRRCCAATRILPTGRRGVPHRRGHRLARARPRPVPGHRAVLPSRLPRQPGAAPGSPPSTASRRSSSAGAQGRRRRLRPRRLDHHPGAGVPGVARSGASTTTRARSTRPARRPPRPGVADRVTFEVASGPRLPGHRLRPGLPSSTACTTWATRWAPRRTPVRSLKPDGTWLLVEPFANDDVADNLNPVGRVFYSASTLICTPASLSQDVGAALGAQAGEGRLREVADAGRLLAVPAGHRDPLQPRPRRPTLTQPVLRRHPRSDRCSLRPFGHAGPHPTQGAPMPDIDLHSTGRRSPTPVPHRGHHRRPVVRAHACDDWDLRQLVNHVISGNLWAAELAAGGTIAEVGDRLDGDVPGPLPSRRTTGPPRSRPRRSRPRVRSTPPAPCPTARSRPASTPATASSTCSSTAGTWPPPPVRTRTLDPELVVGLLGRGDAPGRPAQGEWHVRRRGHATRGRRQRDPAAGPAGARGLRGRPAGMVPSRPAW